MIKEIFSVIYKFIRGTIRLIIWLLLTLVTFLMSKILHEEGITKRKIRRVKFFTKAKLFYGAYLPHLASFLGHKVYLDDLKERMK